MNKNFKRNISRLLSGVMLFTTAFSNVAYTQTGDENSMAPYVIDSEVVTTPAAADFYSSTTGATIVYPATSDYAVNMDFESDLCVSGSNLPVHAPTATPSYNELVAAGGTATTGTDAAVTNGNVAKAIAEGLPVLYTNEGSYKSGTAFADGNKHDAAFQDSYGTISAQYVEAPDNTYVQLKGTNGMLRSFIEFSDITSDKAVTCVDFKLAVVDAAQDYIDFYNASGERIIRMGTSANSNLQFRNGGGVQLGTAGTGGRTELVDIEGDTQKLTADTWYTLKIVTDTVNNTAEVYFAEKGSDLVEYFPKTGSKLYGLETAMYNATEPVSDFSLAKVSLCAGSSSGQGRDIAFDNVKVSVEAAQELTKVTHKFDLTTTASAIDGTVVDTENDYSVKQLSGFKYHSMGGYNITAGDVFSFVAPGVGENKMSLSFTMLKPASAIGIAQVFECDEDGVATGSAITSIIVYQPEDATVGESFVCEGGKTYIVQALPIEGTLGYFLATDMSLSMSYVAADEEETTETTSEETTETTSEEYIETTTEKLEVIASNGFDGYEGISTVETLATPSQIIGNLTFLSDTYIAKVDEPVVFTDTLGNEKPLSSYITSKGSDSAGIKVDITGTKIAIYAKMDAGTSIEVKNVVTGELVATLSNGEVTLAEATPQTYVVDGLDASSYYLYIKDAGVQVYGVDDITVAEEESSSETTTVTESSSEATSVTETSTEATSVTETSTEATSVAETSTESTTENTDAKVIAADTVGVGSADVNSLKVGDEVIVSYKLNNITGINNFTFYVDFDPALVQLQGPESFDVADAVTYDLSGNAVRLVTDALINKQMAIVPKYGNTDYTSTGITEGNTKTAAELGRIKLAGVAGLDSSSEAVTNTDGVLFKLKFKVLKAGTVNVGLTPVGGVDSGKDLFYQTPVSGEVATPVAVDTVEDGEVVAPATTTAPEFTYDANGVKVAIAADGTLKVTGTNVKSYDAETGVITLKSNSAITASDLATAIAATGTATANVTVDGSKVTVADATDATKAVTLSFVVAGAEPDPTPSGVTVTIGDTTMTVAVNGTGLTVTPNKGTAKTTATGAMVSIIGKDLGTITTSDVTAVGATVVYDAATYTATLTIDGKDYKLELFKFGDVDGDGAVTANDATIMISIYNNMTTATDIQTIAGDTDKDNAVTANDATLAIARYNDPNAEMPAEK